MGPGGWADWGSPPVNYMGGQVGLLDRLSLEEVGHIITGVGIRVVTGFPSLGFGLLHWNYHVFKDQTDWLDYETWFSPTPGGGGPGSVVTSTEPPLSVEESGIIYRQGAYPMKGGRPDSPKASRGRSRKRCSPGYRWNGHRCVRKD